MAEMLVFAYFILSIPSYEDVDGQHFSSREECRKYAIAKFNDLSAKDQPDWWNCQAVMVKIKTPFINREIQSSGALLR